MKCILVIGGILAMELSAFCLTLGIESYVGDMQEQHSRPHYRGLR
jgi:hypothetical protein